MNIAQLRLPSAALVLTALLAGPPLAVATTPLADQPVFTNTSVPGNLVLALSAEFPTVLNAAHQANFVAGTRYLGYFDPAKCYRYYKGNATHDAAMTGDDVSHFVPVGAATAAFKCTASGLTDTWSGSFLNWLTMQSIDPFRWALTGGYRRVDKATVTILERAWATAEGGNDSGDAQFRVVGTSGRDSPSSTDIADHTPLSFPSIKVSVRKRGNQIWFTQSASLDTSTTGTPTHYTEGTNPIVSALTMFYARVKVCDTTAGVEANCKAYPSGAYKPEGLLQQYADRIRFSAFGYLNDPSDNVRDGGVLRARQKFVGPYNYIPGSPPTTNTNTEWDATTGIQFVNPDTADATSTNASLGVTVNNSGVINYLNKFGQEQKTFKRRDPVSELYYGALRYLRNIGYVPEWSNIAGASDKVRLVDGFPVITNWDDPILYSCQRNFILGIGDTNTNWDRNVPGSSGGGNEPSMPSLVSGDTTFNAVTATNKVGVMQGVGGGSLGTAGISSGSYLIAGLAWDANTRDIRLDDPTKPQTLGKQTVSTYWLDVLEFGAYASNNQYYLAAKYGGFEVPALFNPDTHTGPLTDAWWRTNTDTVGGQPRPDNYFTAARPDQVVAGLTAAFARISSALRAYTTSFATSLPQTSLVGNISYGAQYDSSNWSGEVQANTVAFDATTGTPSLTLQWNFSAKLTAQIAEDSGAGWNTRRNVVTWKLTTGATSGAAPMGSAVGFRHANLSAAQTSVLDTIYRSGNDSADFVNYLRGDKTHEENSTVSGSAKIYRNRSNMVGDIVGSRVRPVGPPAAPFAAATNPGYGTFKTTWAARPTVVYVGSNAGMMHAINGAITGTTAGRELFAYVPDMLFRGPNGTPAVDGLVARGDPNFTHKAMVDGSATAFDVDFSRTQNDARSALVGGANNWRSILVGGMGKGGRGYYAIDVTDPASMISEALVSTKVLWEISAAHPDFAELGYTYGEPTAVKTRKWGWVLIFGSGYNNAGGAGWFFIVNPRNGALLEKISTGAGTFSAQAGMAHVQSYIIDRTDGTADAVYAGDLLGNLWRWDLRAITGAYPAPQKIAELTNASGVAQAVTSRPMVVVHPPTNRRYVTVGTGRLLDNPDISSATAQSFYAVIDGTANTFAATGPGGAAFPVTRSQLVEHTDLTMPVVVDTATKGGWWVNLGVAAAGNGWRVITEPSAFYGVVTFVAMVPNTSACNPSGISRVYSVDLGSGQSQLINASGAIIPYSTALSGVVIEHRTYSVDGKPRLVACNDLGTCEGLRRLPPGAIGMRRLNWRELPLAD